MVPCPEFANPPRRRGEVNSMEQMCQSSQKRANAETAHNGKFEMDSEGKENDVQK